MPAGPAAETAVPRFAADSAPRTFYTASSFHGGDDDHRVLAAERIRGPLSHRIRPPSAIHHELVFMPAGRQLNLCRSVSVAIVLQRGRGRIPAVEISGNEDLVRLDSFEGKMNLAIPAPGAAGAGRRRWFDRTGLGFRCFGFHLGLMSWEAGSAVAGTSEARWEFAHRN